MPGEPGCFSQPLEGKAISCNDGHELLVCVWGTCLSAEGRSRTALQLGWSP